MATILNQTSFSQSGSIFSFLSSNPAILDSQQLLKYNKVASSNYYLNPIVIQTQSLIATQDSGKVQVTFPGLSCSGMSLSASNVHYTDENDYYWYGQSVSDSDYNCTGSLTLMARAGEKFGILRIDSFAYEYHDLGGGLQVLAEVNIDSLPFQCNAGGRSLTQEQGIEDCPQNSYINVFVYYTAASDNMFISIHNRIELAVAEMNQALINSHISTFDAQINLVGTALLTNFSESNSMSSDFTTFQNRSDVSTMMINTQADIAFLFTNGNYNGDLGLAGIGPNSFVRYGIIQAIAAPGPINGFGHEFGHLFGCRHQDAVSSYTARA